ncbi:hypothetical protein ElyMa_001490100 [Elysia marginata]|uniref:Uncharacterized protein n=1 Tax=Elysia marginata TaxID=1093978 RepID=A0AAV4J495_9GAST|nr:hypothetical protein ElyMa_001490100 [Elysia marginata]
MSGIDTRYLIDLGCFSFFLIIFLSLVVTLMVCTAVVVEEALDSDRHKTRLALQVLAWAAILVLLRETKNLNLRASHSQSSHCVGRRNQNFFIFVAWKLVVHPKAQQQKELPTGLPNLLPIICCYNNIFKTFNRNPRIPSSSGKFNIDDPSFRYRLGYESSSVAAISRSSTGNLYTESYDEEELRRLKEIGATFSRNH